MALQKGDNMLNKQTEVLNNCRHKNKYSLTCYDTKVIDVTKKVTIIL